MDWFIGNPEPSSGTEIRHEVGDYLRRHAAPGEDLAAAILAFAEVVNNAIEHGDGPVWVSVDWTARTPTVTVTDLGRGFDLEDVPASDLEVERGRGLAIAASLAQRLEVHARESGGSRVEVELSVRRPTEVSVDPPRRRGQSLPDLAEASPDGFDREPFLRALVVQLAQEAERREGPAAAEALVAQVGIDVGSQMEAEYRQWADVDGPLTPSQLADCYVRLKHAIEGDFYPLEVSDTRIVLGNRRCPFGLAVRKAPALCRMTSSVFGGIAAQNGPGATVILAERIAVGDDQCRVVVELGEPSQSDDRHGHRYFPPVVDSN